MKDSLKTFPEANFTVHASHETLKNYVIKVVDWKIDFEKELQQIKGIVVLDDDDNEIDQLISKKEVLGVSEK